MNKPLIFFFISFGFLCFSLVSIFTAPIINKNSDVFEKWGKLNCAFYCDQERETRHVDEIQKWKKLKNLCNRQKAMYNLEYASLIIDIVLGLITTHLSLFVYFKVGGNIVKISGLFGIITGIICFILTLVYICYSTYIFNNDTAFKVLDPSQANGYTINREKKLFPNGAYIKWVSNTESYTPYHGDSEDDAQYIKYKELGQNRYNYERKYFESFNRNSECRGEDSDPRPTHADGSGCEYSFSVPKYKVDNKYLYDNWITNIVFTFLIVVFALLLIIFGIILFKDHKDSESLLPLPNSETIQIEKKN